MGLAWTFKGLWPPLAVCLAIKLAGPVSAYGALPSGSTPVPTEYQVKAAFLFNFAKFVEWPPGRFGGPNAPLVIGVLGEDPFGEALEQSIQNKEIQGRPIELRRLRAGEDLEACHVLFVSRSENARLGPILGAVKNSAVLTVGEMEQFLEQGGMINFFIEADSVKFEINPKAAEQCGLKLSAKLLAVSRTATTSTKR